jgi:hypothetical protein
MEKELKRKRFVIPKQFLLDKVGEPAMQTISIVTEPAIQSEFIMFNKEENIQEYKPTFELFSGQDEQMKITGVAMIPYMNILRRDKKSGEPYYGFFTPEDIELLVEGMFKYKYINNFSLQHNGHLVNDIQFLEGFITTADRFDKRFDVPVGSWIITCKVHSFETWNKIKEEGFTGFSIEAFLDSIEEAFSKKIISTNDVLQVIIDTVIDDLSITK